MPLNATFALLAAAAAVMACDAGRGAQRALIEPITGAELVLIQRGSFTMGTPDDEFLREPQEALHRVELTRDFYLGRHEVTQQQWRSVMDSSPSKFTECGPHCPVETVSYHDIERFLDRLVELGGLRLRLPSEAEWEYACRAGGTAAFSSGPTLTTEQANFDGSTPYPGAPPGRRPVSPSPVGSFSPNTWGLYDMHGNVWEWTADRYCPYEGDAVDPVPDCGSSLIVIRGGSWLYGADSARCGLRYTHRPQDDGPSLGFRLARDVDPS